MVFPVEKILILSLVLFSPFLFPAERKTGRASGYIIDNWTIEEGLPQNSVTKIAQTPDGYIWLATRMGLARFDGATFTTFTNRETQAIPNLPIRNLYVDRQGGLWIASQGAGVIYYHNDHFTAYSEENGLLSNTVWSITESSDGTIWIGTRDGLNRFQGGVISAFPLPKELDPPDINTMYTDPEGRIWVGTINCGGILQKQGQDWQFAIHPALRRRFINGFYSDSRNRLWFFTNTEGLFTLESNGSAKPAAAPPLATGAIYAMVEDRERNLWIATYNNGLFRMNDSGITRFGTEDGLSTDSLFAVFEDRERNLWIGTEGGGLNRLKKARVTTYTEADGMATTNSGCIFCDSHGRIWFGSTGQGVTCFSQNRFRTLSTRTGFPVDTCFHIIEDRKGNLWFATYGQGVFEKRGNHFIHYQAEQGIDDPNVMILHLAPDDSIWAGTELGNIYRKEGDHFVRKFKYDSSIDCLISDRKGDLWIGTFETGLIRIHDGIETVFDKKTGFPSNSVYSIKEDRNGTLWVSTGDGLGIIKDDRFIFHNEAEGLPVQPILMIVEDQGGRLWLGSRKGIFGVERDRLFRFITETAPIPEFIQLGKEDGMRSIEIRGSASSGCMDHKGNIWFTTTRGVTMFHPDSLKINTNPPPVVITKLQIDDRPYQPAGPITAPPGKGRIEISYSALTYGNPKRVFFKYRLNGYEDEWVDAGTRRTAYYTNLEPGTYSFHVQACNSDGIWNEAGAAIKFLLRPHFFQTGWFYFLSILGSSLLILSGYRWRVGQLRQRKKELEGLVAERTTQLAESNDHLARANRELEKLATLDGLTGIANHRAFQEFLTIEWRRSQRNRRPIAAILGDVDHFKTYNDSFGHQAGDLCLKQVAKLFDRAGQRAGDLAARYGGEEFILILSETDEEGTRKIAENLRQAVEKLAIPHRRPDELPILTISLGYAAIVPGNDDDPFILVEAADRALYQSKRNGRNLATPASES